MLVKIIKGVFKGENGSLGYVKGREYTLYLKSMTITRLDQTGRCRYGSIESFLNNWDVIK